MGSIRLSACSEAQERGGREGGGGEKRGRKGTGRDRGEEGRKQLLTQAHQLNRQVNVSGEWWRRRSKKAGRGGGRREGRGGSRKGLLLRASLFFLLYLRQWVRGRKKARTQTFALSLSLFLSFSLPLPPPRFPNAHIGLLAGVWSS